ncbi:MAG: hypothetical protein RL748_2345 [Pseudomonadota bacterium]
MFSFSLNHRNLSLGIMLFLCTTLLALPIMASATTRQHLNHASNALTDQATPWQLPHRYFKAQGQQLLIVATRPRMQPHAPQIEAVEGLRFLFKPTQEFTEARAWPLTKKPASSLPSDTRHLSQQILAAMGKGERVFVICDERHFAAMTQAIEQGLPPTLEVTSSIE